MIDLVMDWSLVAIIGSLSLLICVGALMGVYIMCREFWLEYVRGVSK